MKSRSKEYLNALDYKGFIKELNGLYNSEPCPPKVPHPTAAAVAAEPPTAEADNGGDNPGPPYYWSVTHGAFVKGPSVIIGAPTQLQIHVEECQRLLNMRFSDKTWSEEKKMLQAPLSRESNIRKLIANPRLLAKIFGVECLFEWFKGGGPNFVSVKPGTIERYGFE